MMRRMRWIGVGLVVATYLVLAGALLLWPNGAQVRRLIIDAYVFGLYRVGLPLWVTPEWYEAGGNVLLFIPLGLGLALVLGRRWWWLAPLLGAALSMAVELAQSLRGMARVSEWADVVTNGIGALLGALVGGWLLSRWSARQSRHEALRGAAAGPAQRRLEEG